MSSWHNQNTQSKPGWEVKTEVSISDVNDQNRVSFNMDDFENSIKQQGVRVKIFRTMFCPNVKSIDGAEHEINCNVPGCNGSGFIDKYPIEATVLIQHQQLDKKQYAEGYADAQNVTMTLPIGIEAQYFTLVELRDFTEIYFQRFAKSATKIDNLKYAAKRVNVLVDKTGKEYFANVDFTLDQNCSLMWKTGKAPATNTILSIHYEAPVQFRMVKALKCSRYVQIPNEYDSNKVDFVKAPELWLASKEYFVKRKDVDGNEIIPG